MGGIEQLIDASVDIGSLVSFGKPDLTALTVSELSEVRPDDLEQTHGVQENQQDGDRNRNLQQEHPALVEQAQPAAREEFLLA